MDAKHLTTWEVIIPNSPEPFLLVARGRDDAIQAAIELFPGINPNAVSIHRHPEWK